MKAIFDNIIAVFFTMNNFRVLNLVVISFLLSGKLFAQNNVNYESPTGIAVMIIMIPLSLFIGHKFVYPIFRAFFVSKNEKIYEEYNQTRFDKVLKLIGTWVTCVGGTFFTLTYVIVSIFS